ncbi:MAG: Maf family protein [Burkholderiales bacterium]
MKHGHRKIYLASKSLRRRELLQQIGIDFVLLRLREQEPRGPDVTELVLPGEHAHDYVARVTREKAACACQVMLARKLPIYPILAADTTVAIDDAILGKPASPAEAAGMLAALSGCTHQVLTSVVVQHDEQIWQVTQSSDVLFDNLSKQTIDAYCASSEPYDKAGGYGIQGTAASFIKHISGSYTGIMGLPLFETAQLLRQAGLRIL